MLNYMIKYIIDIFKKFNCLKTKLDGKMKSDGRKDSDSKSLCWAF